MPVFERQLHSGFSEQQWSALTSGAQPRLGRIIDRLVKTKTDVYLSFQATPHVKKYFENHPEHIGFFSSTDFSLLSDHTFSTIAQSISWEKRIQFVRKTPDQFQLTALVQEMENAKKTRRTIPLNADVLSFIFEHQALFNQQDLPLLFTNLDQLPDPELTREDQQAITLLLNQYPGALQQVIRVSGFNHYLNHPWDDTSVDTRALALNQLRSMALKAIDGMELPSCPTSYSDSPEERLALLVWFRKHRHLIFRSCSRDQKVPIMTEISDEGSPSKQLTRLIRQRIELAGISEYEHEAVSTLLCCIFNDDELNSVLKSTAINLEQFPVKDRLYIALHRSSTVAARVVESFGMPPDNAVLAIGCHHPGLLGEEEWKQLSRQQQLILAQHDSGVARTLEREGLPPSQSAWLRKNRHEDCSELLQKWHQACKEVDHDEDGKAEWFVTLQQLAGTESGSAAMVKSDFPWPQDDGAFKRRMHLCLLEQSPDVVTREFLLNILAEKKGRIPAGKKLTFFLSKYYSQVKAKQLLSREEILGIKFFKLDEFLLDNENAAHDFWPLCDDTKILKLLSDKSLGLSLSMLEEMQLRPEALKIAPVKLYELLLNSPHPEIKRRVEFIGFAQLTGKKQFDRLIKASLEKRISVNPVFKVILDDAELLSQFTLMVQTGHGTIEGNLDDLAEMTKEDIIQYLNEEECAPREKSLGVRTLLLLARDPGKSVKPSRDKLLSGAIRFEAVAREFLQSGKEEIRQLFPDESHRIKLIGKHQQLAIETLRDKTFPDLSDEVKIEWAVKHRKIGWAFLRHVTDYLTHPDKLLPETLVKICRRDESADLRQSIRFRSILPHHEFRLFCDQQPA